MQEFLHYAVHTIEYLLLFPYNQNGSQLSPSQAGARKTNYLRSETSLPLILAGGRQSGEKLMDFLGTGRFTGCGGECGQEVAMLDSILLRLKRSAELKFRSFWQ